MKIFEMIGIDAGYVILGLCALVLILLIMIIVALTKIGNMKKKYEKFMDGNDGQSLEEAILHKFSSIDTLEENVLDIYHILESHDVRLTNTYQKIGIVKYDAFKEIGGKLSFCITLLTDNNDGFILNTMHSSKEGCYTYIKEISSGESFVTLSKEEEKSLQDAINFKEAD